MHSSQQLVVKFAALFCMTISLLGVGFVPLSGSSHAKPADVLNPGFNRAAMGPRIARQFDNLSGTAYTASWPSRTNTLRGFQNHGRSVGASNSVEYDLSARQTIQHGQPYAHIDSRTGKRSVGYKSSTSDKYTAVDEHPGQRPVIKEHYRLPPMPEQPKKQFSSGTTAGVTVQNTNVAAVATHLRTHGRLPDNYVTKTDARVNLNWKEGAPVTGGKSIGGSPYGNYQGELPVAQGRQWRAADINYPQGQTRNGERLFYSNDGLIYYNNKSVDDIFYEVR